MERGPVALFGAIVAVGLGPALWLGAQFGRFDVPPAPAPAAVDRQHKDTAQLTGGSGAGEKQTVNDTTPLRTTPRAQVMPLAPSPSASSSRHHTHPSVTPSTSHHSATPSDSPSPSVPPSPSTVPSTGDNGGDDSVPPTPPTDDGGDASPGDGNGADIGTPVGDLVDPGDSNQA